MKDSEKISFGERIKSIRTSMAMSQIQFANLLGWKDHVRVAQIEKGSTPFPPDKVLALCRIAPEYSVETIIDYLLEAQREKIKEKVYSVYTK